jgi:hypothetical protein
MLKTVLKLLYKNSYIIRNKNIGMKNLFKNYLNQSDTTLLQKGGSQNINLIDKLNFIYNDIEYIFFKSEIDEGHYVLYSTDEYECVSILIDRKNKLAEIHGIGNYKTCVITTDSNTSVGTILLNITIKILKKYKDKLGINKIILTDNSIKNFTNNINIELSTMLILIYGETWYGKYGFRPYDMLLSKLDEINNNKYNKNIQIMKNITITDANILKYIKLTNKKSIIEDVEYLLKKYPNYLLSDFIKSFLKKYDKSCKYFNLFYKQLFDSIKLTSFYKGLFVLKI